MLHAGVTIMSLDPVLKWDVRREAIIGDAPASRIGSLHQGPKLYFYVFQKPWQHLLHEQHPPVRLQHGAPRPVLRVRQIQ